MATPCRLGRGLLFLFLHLLQGIQVHVEQLGEAEAAIQLMSCKQHATQPGCAVSQLGMKITIIHQGCADYQLQTLEGPITG